MKILPVSEFARRMGCDAKTIARYIAEGKLHGPALTTAGPSGKTKIVAVHAERQYQEIRGLVNHRFARAIHSGKPTKHATKGAQRPAPEPPPAEDFDAPSEDEAPVAPPAKRRRGDTLTESGPRRPQPQGGNLKSGPTRVDADISGTAGMNEEELSELSINDLTKKEAVLRVLAKQLEIGEKDGTLIKKTDVYDALFLFGQEIRARFEAIPDRIIDNLLAAPSRNEALLLLSKEINSALGLLSDPAGVKLTGQRTSARAAL